ncbi:hypothetical protein B7494_g8336 [Chlorociboria aeruginascens]|nr:hypothetical protein B7494_g8336 [Chlorociboria aeruginascens]
MASEYTTASEGGNSTRHEYSQVSATEIPSAVSSNESSASPSRPNSPNNNPPTKRGRVRFNSTSESNEGVSKKQPLNRPSVVPHAVTAPKSSARPLAPPHKSNSGSTSLLKSTPERESENPFDDPTANPVVKPKPSLLRNNSYASLVSDGVEELDGDHEKAFSALAAQERAQRVASLVGSNSAPASRRTSLESDDDSEPGLSMRGLPVRLDDIPLMNLGARRTYDGQGYESDEDDIHRNEKPRQSSTSEAHKLVRAHTRKSRSDTVQILASSTPGLISGQVTPTEEQTEEYVPRPQHYRGGVLSSLLKLYNPPEGQQSRRGSVDTLASPSHPESIGSSGRTTPRTKTPKWYQKNQSHDTLVGLVDASTALGAPSGVLTPKRSGTLKPGMGKRTSSGTRLFESARDMISGRPNLEDEIRITVHIAETLSRQKYLVKLCRALISYGAPTHRMEEYMRMSARVLEIDGQFFYLPGCMMISFDDTSTHTTEVKLVRSKQGVDLGKLKDVHEIYKEVVHDVIGVEEATQRLDTIIRAKQKHNAWLLVLVYGFASASVAPFGFLQLILAPRSELYSNVFEISAAVLTSFLARAFGSIQGGTIFCFSALAQSSIALILPGYIVLCAALELQSRSIIAGSVRMVYAIIYSLFLGYGITMGTALYGLFDANATSATSCQNPIPAYYRFFFVPLFSLCLTIANQAKWKQTPVMLIIAFAGYIVNFFAARQFPSSAQLSSTLGAFTVGVLGNLYSRLHHGVAAAALLPAIFVQVPSGLAAGGSLLAGISSADEITNSTTYANGTAKVNGTSSDSVTSNSDLNTIVFNVGYSMIQIAIAITVGLFLSVLVVYPFGKRRSGLFSF